MDPRPLFYFAAAREKNRSKRETGEPWPWTDDPVLRDHKFCNTFREDDATTRWFRAHAREPMRDSRAVLFATIWFRCWCNRPDAAEGVFAGGGDFLFAEFLRTRDANVIGDALRTYAAGGKDRPLFSAAYKIMGDSSHKDKLQGTIVSLQKFMDRFDWKNWPSDATIEGICRYFETFDGIGPFLAFQVACDLRHTALLDHAPDAMTFAVAGPGAIRGLNRMHGRKVNLDIGRRLAREEMRHLLGLSQSPEWWGGPPFELAGIQHLCCETDKMLRIRAGEGRGGGSFKPKGVITARKPPWRPPTTVFYGQAASPKIRSR